MLINVVVNKRPITVCVVQMQGILLVCWNIYNKVQCCTRVHKRSYNAEKNREHLEQGKTKTLQKRQRLFHSHWRRRSDQ